VNRRTLLRAAGFGAIVPFLGARRAAQGATVTTQTDIINNDGQKHLITAPFTIRSYTVVNSGALSVFILDGLGNRLDVVDPGETTSANWGGTSLAAQFAAATTGSATIITSDSGTQPASSFTPGFGPSATIVAATLGGGPPVLPASWVLADSFAFVRDTYELLWWRVAITTSSPSNAGSVLAILSPPGEGFVSTEWVIYPANAAASATNPPGMAGGSVFPAPLQFQGVPGQHFQLLLEQQNSGIPAGSATVFFTLGLRRRTFTN
jgi:hypothetical protein